MSFANAPWLFIVNPVAGNGKAGQQWVLYVDRLKQAFPNMSWRETSHPKEATQLAYKAAKEGQRHIVAVGGDGTHHEVINGIIEALGPKVSSQVLYALLPIGSGNDWIRTHGIPKNVDRWIAMLINGKVYQQNLGRIYYKLDGKMRQCVFANVAGLAYDAYVVKRSASTSIKSRLLYPLLTLWYLKDYITRTAEITYDDQTPVAARFYTINIGICKYSGGGMRLVPQAVPTGYYFALTYAKRLSVLKIILNSWRFYTGSIGNVKEVTTTQARSVQIISHDPHHHVEVEADGEWLGYGPVQFALLPEALSFIGPKN